MSEWTLAKLADVADIRFSNVDKKTTPGEPSVRLCNYMDVYGNDYITADLPFMVATASPNEITRFEINLGDVMITKDSETPDDIGIAAVVTEEIADLVCGYHLALLKPDESRINPAYLAKQLGTPAVVNYFARRASGSTRYGLSSATIASTPIPLAPLPQQRRIAEILGTVDEVIEQTEALIAKQQQVKAGLMHDLFTRGVTATGQLRPPPAEAPHLYHPSPLGPIPKEWEPTTIGACLIGIDAGKSPECPDTPPTSDQWGVLKVGAVHPDGLRTEESKVILNPALQNPAYLVTKDDLLFSRANTSELVGLSCHVTIEPRNLMLSDKTLRLRSNTSRMTTRFMFWTLQTAASRRQIENAATGTSNSMKNIGQGSLRDIACLRPELDEQTRITERIDALWTDLAAETAHLAKLRQQKQGLMHDLLTARVPIPA